MNPLLKAPTLVADDGTVLMESNVILDYLASVDQRVAALRPSKSACAARDRTCPDRDGKSGAAPL